MRTFNIETEPHNITVVHRNNYITPTTQYTIIDDSTSVSSDDSSDIVWPLYAEELTFPSEMCQISPAIGKFRFTGMTFEQNPETFEVRISSDTTHYAHECIEHLPIQYVA